MLLPLKAIVSKKQRKDGTSVIYFQYCYSSTNRVLLNTQLAIPKTAWNSKRQCISKLLPENFGNYELLNKELDRIKKIIEAIMDHGQKNQEPNIGEYVSKLFTPNFKIESLTNAPVFIPLKKKEPDFFSEIKSYILSKEKKVAESGKGNFRMMKDHLFAFEEFRKKPITFGSLDFNFYSEYVEFLTYDYQLKRKTIAEFGLRQATIGKTIKQLRMFIKDRVRRKIIAPIDMTDFTILDEESDAVYLSYEEIGRMYHLDLSDDPTMAMYRDMFVLGCLTGLRFSDFTTLSWADLRNELLFKKTNKLDNWCVIPLRSEAREILERHYKESVPKVSNPVFNRLIKDVAERAGINEPISFRFKKGNTDITLTKPKSQWVTTHTCRRSFCTCEFMAGTEVTLIMRISGHKTAKEFYKYIRISPEQGARMIREIWLARNGMTAFAFPKTA